MIYRPGRIGAFECAVLAAHRAKPLMRGCVPRVAGGHKSVVTAQLEVIAGKVVRAVEGIVQDQPDAVGSTQASAVLCEEKEQHRGRDVATSALASVGLNQLETTPNGPVTRGDVSRAADPIAPIVGTMFRAKRVGHSSVYRTRSSSRITTNRPGCGLQAWRRRRARLASGTIRERSAQVGLRHILHCRFTRDTPAPDPPDPWL